MIVCDSSLLYSARKFFFHLKYHASGFAELSIGKYCWDDRSAIMAHEFQLLIPLPLVCLSTMTKKGYHTKLTRVPFNISFINADLINIYFALKCILKDIYKRFFGKFTF